MNVKIVRLNSGEEILCDLLEGDTHFKLKKPLIIIPTGEGKIGFMSWMPYVNIKEGVDIRSTFIAFVVDPDDELKEDFIANSTGIVSSQRDKKKVVAPVAPIRHNTILPNTDLKSDGPIGRIDRELK